MLESLWLVNETASIGGDNNWIFGVKFMDAAVNAAKLATKEVRATAPDVLQRKDRRRNDALKGRSQLEVGSSSLPTAKGATVVVMAKHWPAWRTDSAVDLELGVVVQTAKNPG